MKKITFTDEQIENIIDLYKNHNYTLKRLGEEFNVSRSTITRLINSLEIKKRNRTPKYQANYQIFKEINSNEKAYWLGFIAADGCLYSREHNASLIISLARKDRSHLEKFKIFMNSNTNIIDFVNTSGFNSIEHPCEMSKIVFNSKELFEDCANLNITARKSLTMGIPNIDSKYYLPFILGYFDGDGSIFKLANGEYGINIIGSYDFIMWVNDVLKISSKLEQRKLETPIYHIRCGGTNKPYQIMKQLYDSCDIHLDRKYNIFKELETVVLDRNIKDN